MRTRLLVIAASLLPAICHAWTYQEHFALSLTSYLDACRGLEQELKLRHPTDSSALTKWRAVCANPYIAICQAHLAALAGDYIPRDAMLGEDKTIALRPTYLHHGPFFEDGSELNCGDFARNYSLHEGVGSAQWKQLADGLHRLPAENEKGVPPGCLLLKDGKPSDSVAALPALLTGKQRLYESGFIAGFDWARLATKNYEHFQPDSVLEFNSLSSSYRKYSADVQKLFVAHAYALHYLEDAYSAGHIGIDRKPNKDAPSRQEGLRQDYAHAYHDDINGAGQFLSTDATNFWFGYGDKRLCAPSYFVEVDQSVRQTDAKSLLTYLSEDDEIGVDGATWNVKDKFLDQLNLDLKRTPDSPRKWLVLSLIKRAEALRSSVLCSWIGICEKASVVLGPPSTDTLDHCEPVHPEKEAASGIHVTRCLSTFYRVFQAVQLEQMKFLRTFIGVEEPDGVPAAAIVAPYSYRSISTVSQDTKLVGELNSRHLVVEYDRDARFTRCDNEKTFDFDCKHANSNRVLPTQTLGLGASSNFGSRPYLNAQTFFFSYTAPFGDRNAAIADDKGSALFEGKPFTVEIGLAERTPEHWRALSSLTFHIAPLVKRPTSGEVMNFAFVIGGGANRIWDGSGARNFHVAAGPELQLELGRNVVTVRAEFKEHWNERVGWGPAWMLSVGYGAPSLNLVRSN
jgi:hypothetical protein